MSQPARWSQTGRRPHTAQFEHEAHLLCSPLGALQLILFGHHVTKLTAKTFLPSELGDDEAPQQPPYTPSCAKLLPLVPLLSMFAYF